MEDCNYKVFYLEDFRLRNSIDYSMKNCFTLMDFLFLHYHKNTEDWLFLLFQIIRQFEEDKKNYEVYQNFDLNNIKITNRNLELKYVFDETHHLFQKFFEDLQHEEKNEINIYIEKNFDYLCLTISIDIFLNFI